MFDENTKKDGYLHVGFGDQARDRLLQKHIDDLQTQIDNIKKNDIVSITPLDTTTASPAITGDANHKIFSVDVRKVPQLLTIQNPETGQSVSFDGSASKSLTGFAGMIIDPDMNTNTLSAQTYFLEHGPQVIYKTLGNEYYAVDEQIPSIDHTITCSLNDGAEYTYPTKMETLLADMGSVTYEGVVYPLYTSAVQADGDEDSRSYIYGSNITFNTLNYKPLRFGRNPSLIFHPNVRWMDNESGVGFKLRLIISTFFYVNRETGLPSTGDTGTVTVNGTVYALVQGDGIHMPPRQEITVDLSEDLSISTSARIFIFGWKFVDEKALSTYQWHYIPSKQYVDTTAANAQEIVQNNLNALNTSLAAVAKSGDYVDLTNKPTIGTIQTYAADSLYTPTVADVTTKLIKYNGDLYKAALEPGIYWDFTSVYTDVIKTTEDVIQKDKITQICNEAVPALVTTTPTYTKAYASFNKGIKLGSGTGSGTLNITIDGSNINTAGNYNIRVRARLYTNSTHPGGVGDTVMYVNGIACALNRVIDTEESGEVPTYKDAVIEEFNIPVTLTANSNFTIAFTGLSSRTIGQDYRYIIKSIDLNLNDVIAKPVWTAVVGGNAYFSTLNITSQILGGDLNIWSPIDGTHFNYGDIDRILVLSGLETRPSYDSGGETYSTLALSSDLDSYVPNTRQINGHALSADVTISKEDLFGNYGGTVVTDLNSINFSGFYTCLGTATGAPNSSSSWYVTHVNSSVDTVSATQTAVSYADGTSYKRVKSASTWGAWVQETNRADFDNAGTSLDTIVIKGVKYKVVPCGNANGAGCSIAIGVNSTASGGSSIASGVSSTASGVGSTASGTYSTASGNSSIAIGYHSRAGGAESTASGAYSTASGDSSIAIGVNSTTSGGSSIAIGYHSTASVYGSIAIGFYSTATGNYSTAIGDYSKASGTNSTATGYYSTASGYLSTASGYLSTASGYRSVAIGYEARSNITGWVSFDGNNYANSDPQNNYPAFFSPDYVLFRNANVDYNATATSAYPNLKTLTDYLGTGAPNVVTTETLAGIFAGTSASFDVSGTGTSGDPYIVTPKVNVNNPHARKIYQITATAPASDTYFRFKASGVERCMVRLISNLSAADYGYFFNFMDLFGHVRSRNKLNGGTLVSADINSKTGNAEIYLDVNSPEMYATNAI